MSAVLFGSISAVADTSERQRRAFNDAFAAHGLDWRWDRAEYRAMLSTSGGQARVAEQARSTGQEVDAQAVHATKSQLFRDGLAATPPTARPGVVDTIRAARDKGVRVGLVTTTSPENVAALLAALGPDVRREDFDVVVDASDVEAPKPDGAAYAFALRQLGEPPERCVAVEDNVDGVAAAVAAGVACVAFPNENTAGHDFGKARRVVDHVALAELEDLTR
jgi:HAD superfamily hydrolase (TIGR01509 family)